MAPIIFAQPNPWISPFEALNPITPGKKYSHQPQYFTKVDQTHRVMISPSSSETGIVLKYQQIFERKKHSFPVLKAAMIPQDGLWSLARVKRSWGTERDVRRLLFARNCREADCRIFRGTQYNAPRCRRISNGVVKCKNFPVLLKCDATWGCSDWVVWSRDFQWKVEMRRPLATRTIPVIPDGKFRCFTFLSIRRTVPVVPHLQFADAELESLCSSTLR